MVIINSWPGFQIVRRQLVNREHRFAARRLEDALARSVGQIESAGLAHPLVVVLKAGNDALDEFANSIIVGNQSFPIDRASLPERRARQSATIAGSLKRCGDAGGRNPREACTTAIEFSVVTNCAPVACSSISVRPRQGRINACSPVIKCPRLSLVETCTVKRQRRSASAVYSVSGVAERKLPPSAKKTFARPSCIAWIALTVSRPCSRGGSKSNSAAS